MEAYSSMKYHNAIRRQFIVPKNQVPDNTEPSEYVFWDDLNELLDQLKVRHKRLEIMAEGGGSKYELWEVRD